MCLTVFTWVWSLKHWSHKVAATNKTCCINNHLSNNTLYPCSFPLNEGEDTGCQCTSARVLLWTMTCTLSGAAKGTAKHWETEAVSQDLVPSHYSNGILHLYDRETTIMKWQNINVPLSNLLHKFIKLFSRNKKDTTKMLVESGIYEFQPPKKQSATYID